MTNTEFPNLLLTDFLKGKNYQEITNASSLTY